MVGGGLGYRTSEAQGPPSQRTSGGEIVYTIPEDPVSLILIDSKVLNSSIVKYFIIKINQLMFSRI